MYPSAFAHHQQSEQHGSDLKRVPLDVWPFQGNGVVAGSYRSQCPSPFAPPQRDHIIVAKHRPAGMLEPGFQHWVAAACTGLPAATFKDTWIYLSMECAAFLVFKNFLLGVHHCTSSSVACAYAFISPSPVTLGIKINAHTPISWQISRKIAVAVKKKRGGKSNDLLFDKSLHV